MRQASRSTILLLCGVAAVAIFGAGVIVGAHAGAREFVFMESSVKASLLTGELSALRTGSTQNLINAKELELDAEIVRAMRFQDGNNAWLLWPDAGQFEHARYLSRTAQYRRQFPAVTPKLASNEPEYSRQVEQATSRLVSEYGK